MMILRRLRGCPLVALLLGLALLPAATAERTFTWTDHANGVWPGDAIWPNRLQDWSIRDGGLECHEGAERFPMRTAAVLPVALAADATDAPRGAVRTVLRVLDDLGTAPADRWCGVLIGVGGGTVDPWISALVHHRPARDGGLFCGVDGHGRAIVHDFGSAPPGGGLWSIGGALDPALLPRLAAGDVPPAPPSAVTLDVAWHIDDAERAVLTVTVREDGDVRSTARLADLDPARVRGAVSVVSHRAAHRFERVTLDGTLVERAARFGPIVHALYTLSRDGLVLTAQCVPLPAGTNATLHLERDGAWHEVARATIDDDACVARFHLPEFRAAEHVPYRVEVATGAQPVTYDGVIRTAPDDVSSLRVGSLNCHKCYTGALEWNGDAIWFPHRDLTTHLRAHDPDLLYFAGDQIYEGDLTPADRRDERAARLDYLQRWYRWGIAFRNVTRDRPTIVVPDDHDVYQGNLWGAGGRRAERRDVNGRTLTAQDSGGYVMSPSFVNMVHRTQTAHLPPPIEPRPDAGAISVYTTRLEYGGVSFAILSDRQWKSAPAVAMPDGDVVNGWFQAADFAPSRDADPAGATLLGAEQLAFLERWATDFSGHSWMKVVLSQTPFVNVATLPRGATSDAVLPTVPILAPGVYPRDEHPVADADSGGWPPTPRRRAVRAMRRGFAVHLNGDQHLGSLVQYGVDGWRDSSFSFCAPAIANSWPRRWFPSEPGRNRSADMPRETGDFFDGFGNLMTVWAVCNPTITGRAPARLHDRSPGYGIVTFDRDRRQITFAAWPRGVDPRADDAAPYPGFPRTVTQLDQFPPKPLAWLPQLRFSDRADGLVIEVIDEATGGVLYAIRNNARRFRPWVSSRAGTYTIRVGDPDRDEWMTFPSLRPTDTRADAIEVPPFDAP